ncbi:complex I NDUFA9 subunit family protein [Erythrobacter sp.]|uniref:complex I NDUFA9 subunit family protein n=1 Tax=Erythrobacter sp. TaxID=1042 RepID=UPI00311E16A4
MAKGSALNGKLVVLMGGSGFLGQYVAQALLARGARLRIASRNPEHAFKLKPLANLGQIQFARCDATNRQSVERCLQGADAVVNLIGSFAGNLQRLMGEAPGWMAEAAKAQGAQAFVHVSAITGEGDPENPVAYVAAKQDGERRVLAGFPQATILRPSVLFGKDDNFLNMFAGLIAALPVLPVFGPEAQLQPVYVDDVAEAVASALEAPGIHGGKTYELAGPEVLTMMDINRRIAAAQGRERAFLAVPDQLSALFAALPLTPMSADQWALLKAGNTASGKLPGLDKLGITAKPLGLFLDKWMVRYRKHGRFADRLSA